MKLRTEIAKDPFMARCIYCDLKRQNECRGKIEWEHAWIYAGKQINEKWAIVPVCTYHHRGNGLDKGYNQYRAIIRADISDLQMRMPKRDWVQIKKHLVEKYKTNQVVDVVEFTPPKL